MIYLANGVTLIFCYLHFHYHSFSVDKGVFLNDSILCVSFLVLIYTFLKSVYL